jgi:hypothetical protein
LFLSGLILDLSSAFLAFLTSRWFQRLTNSEKVYLQKVFVDRAREKSKRASRAPRGSSNDLKPSTEQKTDSLPKKKTVLDIIESLLIPWYSLSLFVPMVLLVYGTICIIAGLYTYTWSQHPLPVAIVVSIAGLAALPFVIGVFVIGRAAKRRETIILRLSTMQGDW